MMLQQRGPVRASSNKRSAVRCYASAQGATMVRPTVQKQKPVEAQVVELDVEALHKRLEARSKAMIQLEEQEAATYTKVKFTLKQQIGLGETWKIVGKCPELGRMKPEVAPTMTWNSGDVWTLEAKIRPGTFNYKAVLRKPNGQYIWEDGQDRILEVPFGEPSKNIEVSNIKFPAF